VWWASPHLTGERSKRRPFVVVSANAFNENPRYAKVVVVHLTATSRPGGPFAWEVRLPRGAGGLERASVAKCAEPYTLFKEQLDALCGTLPSRFLDEIDSALALALDLR
jgi:mRNA-degrading endonuclease toxin of MazEF toxin-antitoxin module